MSTQIDFEAGTLSVSRVFDAPRDLVWDAWTRPEIVQQWWGCAQTTNVEVESDLRVGGYFNIVMQGEGYGEMRQKGRITELRAPEILSYVLEPRPDEPEPAVESRITVTFTDVGGKTEVTMLHTGLPDDPFIREMVSGGWTAAFGKLAGVLAG